MASSSSDTSRSLLSRVAGAFAPLALLAALYHQSILERLKIGFKVTSLRRALRIASDSHPLRRIITVQLALPFPNLVSSFDLFSVFNFFWKKSRSRFTIQDEYC